MFGELTETVKKYRNFHLLCTKLIRLERFPTAVRPIKNYLYVENLNYKQTSLRIFFYYDILKKIDQSVIFFEQYKVIELILRSNRKSKKTSNNYVQS